MGKQWIRWQTLFWAAPKLLHMLAAAMKLKDAYSLEEKFFQPRQHIGKQRHAKCCLVKAMVFPRVKYGCKSWTIKEAECRRTDAFELWCWRRLLRVPWTAKRSNQSILKKSVLNIYWKHWCWSWNSNTMATCCEEVTHWKKPWLWERMKAGG